MEGPSEVRRPSIEFSSLNKFELEEKKLKLLKKMAISETAMEGIKNNLKRDPTHAKELSVEIKEINTNLQRMKDKLSKIEKAIFKFNLEVQNPNIERTHGSVAEGRGKKRKSEEEDVRRLGTDDNSRQMKRLKQESVFLPETPEAIVDFIKKGGEISEELTSNIEIMDLSNVKEMDIKTFKTVLEKFPNLKSLTLPEYADNEFLDAVVNAQLTYLTSIDLSNVYFLKLRESFEVLLEKYPTLEALALPQDAGDKFLNAVANAQLANLTSLDLSKAVMASSNAVGALLEKYPNLESLQLTSIYSHVKVVPENLKHTIKEINFSLGLRMDVETIKTALKEFPNLESLKFPNDIDDKFIAELNGIKLENLKNIDLSNTSISASVFSTILKAFPNLESLRLPRIANNEFLDALVDAKLAKLTNLNLNYCYCIDNIDALENLTSLTNLSLNGAVGVKDVSVLEKLPNLHHVTLPDGE